MILLHSISICLTIHITNAYVLLAANIDDFRSIAKRFVPGKLAEQLVEIATDSSNRFQKINVPKTQSSQDMYYEISQQNEGTAETYEIGEDQVKPPQRANIKDLKEDNSAKDMHERINIDDIVERVKERLERAYKLKPRKANVETNFRFDSKGSEMEKDEIHYDNRKTASVRDVIFSTKYKYTKQYTQEPDYLKHSNENVNKGETQRERPNRPNRNKYAANKELTDTKEVDYEITIKENAKKSDTMFFDETDMLKTNDSYEDYVTPKKDQTYESKKKIKYPKRFNIKGNSDDKTLQSADMFQVSPKYINLKKSTDYDHERVRSELKARTEDLQYDDKDIIHDYENRTELSNAKVVTEKSKFGTMIPTRQFYKMSSPNYYGKVPNIAEKYDFNEPIPERDREREDLKPIGNPPASINHKIKLM